MVGSGQPGAAIPPEEQFAAVQIAVQNIQAAEGAARFDENIYKTSRAGKPRCAARIDDINTNHNRTRSSPAGSQAAGGTGALTAQSGNSSSRRVGVDSAVRGNDRRSGLCDKDKFIVTAQAEDLKRD